ncbi:hypothetical protein MMC06_004109 [Schaereria dolodes]|nr:hypothetical protein [Schaereria dolodes]
MITNSSIPSVSPGISSTGGGGIVEGNFRSTSSAVYLFPSFQFVSKLSHNEEAYEEFINFLRKDPNSRSIERSGRRVKEVVVLICGHGARDKRCGIMGPVLLSQFESSLKTAGIPVADKYSAPDVTQPERERSNAPDRGEARVALVSHIGGHRFAGNVVIYIPPDYMMDGKPSPLAGKGIWYGRVEPKHVEGIIEETIKSGNVISELFRGGIGSKGEFLTL